MRPRIPSLLALLALVTSLAALTPAGRFHSTASHHRRLPRSRLRRHEDGSGRDRAGVAGIAAIRSLESELGFTGNSTRSAGELTERRLASDTHENRPTWAPSERRPQQRKPHPEQPSVAGATPFDLGTSRLNPARPNA